MGKKAMNGTPGKLFSLFSHAPLIRAMVAREISAKYKGSIAGLAWYFIQNMTYLILYAFVFGVLFRTRWSEPGSENVGFVPILFLGLILFNIFAECLGRAPSELLYNRNYITKVVFPLEILSIVSLGAALFNGLVAAVLLIVLCPILGASFSWTTFWLPVVLIPFFIMILGLQWFLNSLGIYIRDIRHIVTLVITVMMFTSPVFYPRTMFPERYRFFLDFNPLTIPVDQARRVVFFGFSPNFKELAIYSLVAIIVALCGFMWFDKTRVGFADVL